MVTVAHELRHATRSLAKRPVFTLVVILTLSLGIGANTVVFDLINLTVWKRLPVERPRELLAVHTRHRAEWIGAYGPTSYADYLDYRERATSFSGLAATSDESLSLDTGGATELVESGRVSADFFQVLGVPAAAGRTFIPADEHAGGAEVVVLGHRLWQRLFNGDPEAVGSTVRLDGRPFTVVGVAAEGFAGTVAGFPKDLWVPIESFRDGLETRDGRITSWVGVVGRLRPGVGRGEAQEEIRLLAAGIDEAHPLPERRREMAVVPATLMHALDRNNLLPTLRVLFAAVAVLLLITCANVANLLLARGASRSREMGVRAALGASRGRLVRQLLVESLVLSGAGGVVGLLLAVWARELVALCLDGGGVDFTSELRLDYRVLGLSLLASVVSACLCTVAPAWRAARADLISAIKGDAPDAAGQVRRVTTGDFLVVVQVALSMVLLVGTGLLARSMWNLWTADPGFDTENLLSTRPTVARGDYTRDEGRALYRRLEERAAALPGVRSAGLAIFVPPILLDITAEFRLPDSPDERRSARFNFADAGFFETLGIPLLQGRLFEARDADSAEGVVVINRTLAETLWPGREPLGRTILLEQRRDWEPGPRYEVVGVVGDTIQDSFQSAAQPIVYFSAAQRYRDTLQLVLRTEGDPSAAVAPLRDELRGLDPTLTLEYTSTGKDVRWDYLVLERIRTLVSAAFGLLGLVLAVVGVASVLSYAVSRRFRELGIRMALGARGRDVGRLVLARALALAAAGIVAGGLGALWATQLLRKFLFRVGAGDPWIFGGVAVVLLAAALVAAWMPARRASAVDPLVALRYE